MLRTVLRCHNCGARADVELNESEAETLRRQGYVNRTCRECAGVSRWEAHEAAEAGHSAVTALTDSPGRVLIIDDDESLLAVLSKALARMKFDVFTAYSARSALTLLARHDFDVVLSDIRMPEFDGKQLLAFLDEHMPDAKERVVFITADVGNPETMEFLHREGRPYTGKPLDIPVLLETIRPFLPRPDLIRSREELPQAAVVEPAAVPAASPGQPVPHSQTEQALSYAILVLRQEVDALKRTLEERNAEVGALRKELARREHEGRPPAGAAGQERLQAELEEQKKKAAAASEEAAAVRKESEQRRDELTRVQRELDAARARLAGAESAERAGGKAARDFTGRLAELNKQLDAATRERDQARAAAEDWKRQAGEAAAESARIQGDLHQQLQDALHERDRLRADGEKLKQQAAKSEEWKQQAAEAEAAAQAARQELEYIRGQQEQLGSDAQTARDAAAEADEDRERLERELSVFRGKESAAGELHGQIAALEAELGQAREELERLRRHLEERPAVALPPEVVAAAGEASPEGRAALEREAKRGGARMEALEGEADTARSRALRLENVLRHFYVAAVNPLTVAVATADLASSSTWLSPRDRENLQLLKQNIDTLIETVKVLKKQMQELEIDIK
ncbi:MAG: response regulator [Candidatus Acidiferrales bacterium]